MISSGFVKLWESRYSKSKYPEDFYFKNLKGARNAEQPEQLKEYLRALLHWKDGKTDAFIRAPNKNHAKPNILTPILTLTNTSLAIFAQSFWDLAQADENDMMRYTQCLRAILSTMWQTVVIPAFILHIAKPDRFPIIDQHTVRAFLLLTEGKVLKEPSITWECWEEYVAFFQDAVVQAGYNNEPEERCKVDRALFAWGKSLKDLPGSRVKSKIDKPHESAHNEPAREENIHPLSKHEAAPTEQNTLKHRGEVNLRHSFEDAYIKLEKRGEIESRTNKGTNFTAKATITKHGIHKDKETIRFFNDGQENARVYTCCWGHYYNCNGARIGMYCHALDEVLS